MNPGGGGRSADTRHRLIRTATELFGELGYDRTGIRDIAGQARVAIATVYNHFPDGKAAIAEVALEETMRELTLRSIAFRDDHPVDTFLGRVRILNRGLVRSAFLRRAILDRSTDREPRLRQRADQLIGAVDTVAVTALTTLRDTGQVRPCDPPVIIDLLRSTTLGWAGSHPLSEDPAVFDAMLDIALEALRGYLTR